MEKITVEQWPIDRLIDYIRNPRKNDHAVEKVAAAIHEFGFRVPILAKSDGLIVDGHLRIKAARKLGMAVVPVIVADDMTDIQIKAFRISVNKMADLAGWDIPMLNLELEDLKLEGFDLNLTGFDADEILGLLGDDQDEDGANDDESPKGNLSERFMIPPFSVLNAREGWWQDRKRAWLAIGIQSELGRGGTSGTASYGPPSIRQNPDGSLNYEGAGCSDRFASQRRVNKASQGGRARPAMDYSKGQRGDGKGRPIADSGT